ncbi:MAG: signal peptidase I [Acidipropionibacterium acidipropionici]|uniref:Signal peptidase I n=1 Tax=Acidipropionibacterium acidipropionici (strain ATCC 4875 / DSM 20272 / JCM 6432 / NBRC 12425 / NCIMB 8070 / 4) TaxID=1171373 RepID=K7SKY4_ACIA4|nr:signal peptidase I [Acidipropionibacterium acidipropionici]AFV89915.1 Signal peptidase I [Acidipropionibacterium acidipropionici ATCC 4875]AZP37714.1 signal peptidase I [Acidipropionibacterium acidipropionici]QCV94762.1 signal peptidase I [Acidipropionibacterium acidipropionici]
MAHERRESGRPTDDRQEPVSGWQKFRSGVTELALIVVGALVISSVIRAFVGQLFVIPSGSMEQTLEIGDRVVAMKTADFKRGDIVVFKDSQHWLGAAPAERSAGGKFLEFVGLLPNTSSNYLIKRAIGMPGDTVACCDPKGRVTVNGKALDESAYLYRLDGQTVAPSSMSFKVVVPAGRIFVMGDHRNESGDSRYHLDDVATGEYRGSAAFIPVDDVVGPARAIFVPLSRFRVLHIPDTFSGVPQPSAAAPRKAQICTGDACSP